MAEVEGAQDPRKVGISQKGRSLISQHLRLSESCQQKTSNFQRDFNKGLHNFGEISTKGFMLLERFQRKTSCFLRHLNKKLHSFGEISTIGLVLSEMLNLKVPEVEGAWKQRFPGILKNQRFWSVHICKHALSESSVGCFVVLERLPTFATLACCNIVAISSRTMQFYISF